MGLVLKAVALLSLACLIAASPTPDAEAKHWAVLVAGSSTYFNYRHQVGLSALGYFKFLKLAVFLVN